VIAPATNPSMIIDYAQAGALMEQALLSNDLAKMQPAQRVQFYGEVCKSLKLNPLTRPFQYITLNGKLTLYATKDCTEQLRKINGVSLSLPSKEFVEGLYIVTARATDNTGRTDESTGAIDMGNLKGEARANAIMKAETKAKRRVTLSICGLGWTDESEISSIPNAQPVHVDQQTGDIIDVTPAPERPVAEPQTPAQPAKPADPLKTAKYAVRDAAQPNGLKGGDVWKWFEAGRPEPKVVMSWADMVASELTVESAASKLVSLYMEELRALEEEAPIPVPAPAIEAEDPFEDE